MKKALQILYGADNTGNNNQESQYLLHNNFCSEYSVRSDYSSLNYLGTNPLGSLSKICFPSKVTFIAVSSDIALPEQCFQHILSYLEHADQNCARVAFDVSNSLYSGTNGNTSFSFDNRIRLGGYIIDPIKFKSVISSPRKTANSQYRHESNDQLEETDDVESQVSVALVIEEPNYFTFPVVSGQSRRQKIILLSAVIICVTFILFVTYVVINHL